jgi:hypothetical protein
MDIIKYFMKLGIDNPGSFKALMGNHELLALENLAEARKLSALPNPDLEDYQARTIIGSNSEINRHGSNGGINFIEEFGTDPKSALDNYVQRMSRDGDIGGWMRGLLPGYHEKMNGKRLLFVHAGVPEVIKNRASLDAYLTEFRKYVNQDTDNLGGSFEKYSAPLLVKNGLFWDRNARRMSNNAIDALIERLGVDYIITGHTPNKKVVMYGDRIIDIDIGMCPSYGANTPAALVITPVGISAHYITGEEQELAKF